MGYDSYKDANGVTWRVISASKAISAFMDPDVVGPRYDPDPPDMGPATKPSLDDSATDSEVAERDRRTFINLRKDIDSFANEHKQAVILRVTAKRDDSTLILILIAGWLVLRGR